MTEPTTIPIGWVLRAATTGFAVGCRVMGTATPRFGDFVKVTGNDHTEVIGLIYDVQVKDDPSVRQLILTGELAEEIVLDQRENRLVPIEVSVLVVGYQRNGQIVHNLPPQPPISLDALQICPAAEVRAFTERFDFVRLILKAGQIPADEVLAAALVQAAQLRPPQERRQYLVRAGQVIARQLSGDLLRLDAILQQLRWAVPQ